MEDTNGGGLSLRLLWNAIAFSDPVNGSVIDAPRSYSGFPGRDALRTSRSEGIVVRLFAVVGNATGGQEVGGGFSAAI